jgi:hypothetical protein
MHRAPDALCDGPPDGRPFFMIALPIAAPLALLA